MASISQLPPASTRQHNFEQAVACALHLWPALTLSVSNGWGGPESAEKRDWFAGAIVELFPEFTDAPAPTTTSGSTTTTQTTADEADMEDVETVLLQVMVDEFEVNVDDDSALEVAQQIVRARAQCAAGVFDETNALAERFAKLKGSGTADKAGQMFKKAEDPNQDTDDEPDDSEEEEDDSDVDMGDAPAPAPAPKQKAEPEVDEDGFTMVTKKKR